MAAAQTLRCPGSSPPCSSERLAPLACSLAAAGARRGTLGANPIAEVAQPARPAARWSCCSRRWRARRAGCSRAGPGPRASARTLGLLAFFYAALHFLTYAGARSGPRRAAPSSRTSPSGRSSPWASPPSCCWCRWRSPPPTASMRRLGFPRWQRLHRLAYVAAVLGVVHFFWRVKKDVTEPVIYGAVLALLLAVRVARGPAQAAGARAPGLKPATSRRRGAAGGWCPPASSAARSSPACARRR